MGRMSEMERGITALHGVRPDRVEIFEDDAALYRARRRDRLKSAPVRRKVTFKAWWADATPFQRFYRLWWWAFLGLGGFALGLALMAMLGALWVGFT